MMARPVLTRAERRAGHDQLPVGQQALQTLEMLRPDCLLLGRHGGGEVISRRVNEVDPLGHGAESA